MHGRILFVLFVATAAAVLVLPSSSMARPAYGTNWAAAYPSSNSMANVVSGTTTTCQLCHANAGGGQPWNGYGWAMRGEILGGASAAAAIANVEALDSAANPGGVANVGELAASAQPRWTPGPNNIRYFSTGTTTSGQAPPAAILGDLDPAAAPVPGLGILGQFALGLSGAAGGLLALRRRSRSSS